VAVRLWMDVPAHDRVEFGNVSHEARVFAESLGDPYFSEHPMFDTAAWFEAKSETVRSVVYVPLRAEKSIGLLMLGSHDPHRFSADQGTLYLTRLGEVVSMALRRYAQN